MTEIFCFLNIVKNPIGVNLVSYMSTWDVFPHALCDCDTDGYIMCSGLLVRWSAGTVTNLSISVFTAAIPLKFDPYKPRAEDSYDNDGRH